MVRSYAAVVRPSVPLSAPRRVLVGLLIVAIATALRWAVDPLIHDQIPYFIYVGSAVVATWFGGVAGGVVSTVVAALVGNYLFVSPRFEIVPGHEDLIAMLMFSAVAFGLVWAVGRWKRAETELRRLHAETAAVLDQMPVCVMIADPSGRLRFGNAAMQTVFGKTVPVPATIPEYRRYADYQPFHPDGRAMQSDETPMSRALNKGEVVRDEEVHIVHGDGTRRILNSYAAPVRSETGEITSVVVAMVDVTERKQIEDELLRRQEELRAATLAAEVGVWTWTPGTNHVSVGANWRGLFGVAPDAEVTFETWVNAVHPDDRDRAVDTLNAAWRDGHEFSVEYRIVCPDGRTRWLIDRGRAFSDARGATLGMAGINLDITQRKLAEEALRDANRLKDEFLATLSHELRTPLNAIVGWSSMLVQGDLGEDAMRRAHEAIARNAAAQRDLIDDVLDVSRIVSGKLRLDTRQTDIMVPLREAIDAVRPAASAKRITINTDLSGATTVVLGDSARLQQVFWNLLSNAVKFSSEGGRVDVSVMSDGSHVAVRVADLGAGISAEFLPYVFDRFRQSDSSSTRKHGGLGLGLSIVRHLVELHGGTVDAASNGSGRGATFTVRLPTSAFQERRRGATLTQRDVTSVVPAPDDPPSLCGLRILVVDDQADARELAALALAHYGATVDTAASAVEALDHFARTRPDLLLVDLAMPDVDGYGLLRQIRTMEGPARSTPAIALTAYARDEDRRQALASGFQMHLAKPVESRALVRAIASVRQASNDSATTESSKESPA